MNKSFSTNVFVRGAVVFYGVSCTEPGIYLLTLQHCRLLFNPPPSQLRIYRNGEGAWTCLDKVADEFVFIAGEIGKRIQLPSTILQKDLCH
jgi:hypothetical protein